MIKFFRKIRQRLITENKFSKYLIYAIGEILLVVIGILIALQINNWNEKQKIKTEEIKMLQNFKSSVEGDLIHLKINAETFEGTNNSINTLIKQMEQDLPYHDSLNFHFTNSTNLWSPKIDQEVFTILTSNDLNIISNDSLKLKIVTYYSFAKRTFDVRINRYTNIMEDASKTVFSTRFNALWNNTWNDPDQNESRKLMIPNDYEALKKDKEYLYFLRSLKNQLYFYVRYPMSNARNNAEELLKSIDNELQQVKK